MVPVSYLIGLLSRGLTRNEYITIPEPVGLPAGAVGVSVHTEYQYNAVAVIVEHESFDEVPEGCMYPTIEVTWKTRKVKTEKPK